MMRITLPIISLLIVSLLQACDGGASSSSKTAYEQYQADTDPSTMLVKKCAAKAGIPENNPNHAITPTEFQVMANCIDGNM